MFYRYVDIFIDVFYGSMLLAMLVFDVVTRLVAVTRSLCG